jgi:hypothetical protein
MPAARAPKPKSEGVSARAAEDVRSESEAQSRASGVFPSVG